MKEKANEKIIRAVQIVSIITVIISAVFLAVFMIKHDINLSNAQTLAQYITGGTLSMALIIVIVCLVKSFALVLSPSIIFVVSGLVFEDFLTAVTVNFIASALSLVLTYYLGRIIGTNAARKITKKYKAMKIIDEFTDENTFAVVFFLKAGGYIPSDVTSLIFGAMNMPFKKYFVASNLGLLVLNVLWTIVSSVGDMTNPFSYLIPLPSVIIGIIALYILALRHRKKLSTEEKDESEV